MPSAADVRIPHQITHDVADLARALVPELFVAHTFRDQDVYVDGRGFDRCTFINCDIYVLVGIFPNISNNAFTNCRFHFNEQVGLAMEFARSLNPTHNHPDVVH